MATTSLGRLTLDLAVKLSDFVDGMSKAERETKAKTDKMNKSVNDFKSNLIDSLDGTAVGSAFKNVSSNFKSVGSVAGAAGLAIGAAGTAVVGVVAGLTKLAVETAKADVEMSKLAETAGTGVKSFQTLTHASKQYGVSQEQLSSILADVQEKLGEFTTTGGGGAADFFEQLKVRTGESDDAMQKFAQTLQGKDGVDAVRAIKKQMDEWGITTQEQRFILESLASDLGNLQPILAMTASEWDAYGDSLEEAGIVKSQEAINKSIELERQTRTLTDTYEGIRNKLAQAVIPVLVDLAGELTNAAVQGDRLDTSMSAVDSTITALQRSLAGASAELKLWIHDIRTWAYQFELTKNTVASAFSSGSFTEGLKILQDGDKLSRETFAQAEARRRQIRLDAELLKQGINPKNIGTGVNKGLILSPGDVFGSNAGFGPVTKGGTPVGPYAPGYAAAQTQAIKTGKQLLDYAEAEAKAKEKTAKAAKQTSVSVREAVLGGKKFGVSPGGKFGGARGHNGLDLLTPTGTQVYAPEAGTIKAYGSNASRGGKQMILIADSGKKYGFAHLSSFDVGSGTRVPAGMGIAKTGASGTRPNGKGYGAHLHLTVTDANGKKINPELAKIITGKGLKYDSTVGSANEKAQREEARLAEQRQRAAEQLAKEQQSIRERYMNEREASVNEHNKRLAEIDAKFGAGTAEAAKYRAEEVARFQEEQAERVYSVMRRYQTEEDRLVYEHQQRLQEIKNSFAEDSPEYALALEAQEVYFREEMQRIRYQDGEKYRQAQKHIGDIRNLIEWEAQSAQDKAMDIYNRGSMHPDDYARWGLNREYQSAVSGADSNLANRQNDINQRDEFGEFLIQSEERNKLLQEAKEAHEATMYAIDLEYAERRKELERDVTDNKIAMYQSATSSMLGLMQGFFGESKNLQRLAWAAEKGFTLARILIKEKEAFMNAWASAPFPYNLGAVATTAIQTGALAAAASAITPKGFKTGGYTGNLGVNTVAGVVHGNEYVFDAQATKAIGVDNLERIRKGKGTGELNVQVNNYSNATVDTQKDSDGNLVLTIRDEVKRSWSNLQNPNSHESKMLGRNVQAPRRR